ncbi:Sec63 [Symbiodinium pilosum]|uniref:Sec63 protein n=1 Tax=Symbiodinium pilosum TaxID=2952 RepID=A0A812IV55_SYMPI|nr:Sec63 [Symbiodinium pilosum]
MPKWEVIGGGGTGGLLVRQGQELKSPQLDRRLETGALVEELRLAGDRLHYKLLRGQGPTEGWVSIKASGKALLSPLHEADETSSAAKDESFDKWQVLGVEADSSAAKSEDEVRRISSQKILASLGKPYTVLGLQPGASSAAVRRAYHCLALLHHPDKGGDDVVFKAIATAYKALTEAKTEEGGWRDLEGQAVGPWQGHAPTATKGITCMLFDTFGTPPWESRRLYTGSWQEGVVRCWELSKGEPGKTKPPPRLVGEIAVGGFINDVAAISPFGLLTAQSAGMKPLPGESLRTWNLKTTPFRPIARAKTNAIADDPNAKPKAVTGGDSGRDGNGSTALVAKKDDEELDFVKDEDGGYLEQSTMVYLHYRGVRCISLWPKPENREATPHVAATVSKDILAVSKIGVDGVSLQVPAVWQQADPHEGVGDVNAMQHETLNKIWTGDNGGNLRCWDVNASGKGVVSDFNSQAAGWLSGLAMWPESGVMVCSHSSGIGYIDIRAGKVIRQQYTKESVGKVTVLNWTSPMLFAGIGGELMQYDTRCFADGPDHKPKAVASWSLGSPITSLHCTETGKGHLLVAAGCMNGKVAAFDST